MRTSYKVLQNLSPPRVLRTLALALSVLAGGLLAAPEVYAQNTSVDASANEGRVVTFVITVTGFTTRDNAARYSYRTKDVTAEAGKDYNSRTAMSHLSRAVPVPGSTS